MPLGRSPGDCGCLRHAHVITGPAGRGKRVVRLLPSSRGTPKYSKRRMVAQKYAARFALHHGPATKRAIATREEPSHEPSYHGGRRRPPRPSAWRLAPAAAAAKKNEIRIVGGTKFKAGKYVKLTTSASSRASRPSSPAPRSRCINKGADPAPHTISFVEKPFLPKGFEFGPAVGPLLAAHQVDPETEERRLLPGRQRRRRGRTRRAGVSRSTSSATPRTPATRSSSPPAEGTTFKVTAKKGSTLPYYCAIHPWMQGKINVK